MSYEEQSTESKVPEKNETSFLEEMDFSRPDFTFIPKGNHEWRQQGQFLVCKSCELEHAVNIGPDKLLVGFDQENKPIIKKRKEVEG